MAARRPTDEELIAAGIFGGFERSTFVRDMAVTVIAIWVSLQLAEYLVTTLLGAYVWEAEISAIAVLTQPFWGLLCLVALVIAYKQRHKGR